MDKDTLIKIAEELHQGLLTQKPITFILTAVSKEPA